MCYKSHKKGRTRQYNGIKHKDNAKMTQRRLRYRFKELYDSLNRAKQHELRGLILSQCHVDITTFYRWMNIEADDTRDIDGIGLVIFCEFFGLSPAQMVFNPPVMRTPEQLAIDAQSKRLSA